MIRGVHAMFYTSEPAAARAFFRDKLGLPFTDVGEGWLIFDLDEGDLGFHPVEGPNAMPSGTPLISFYCADIEKTVAELSAKGVEFLGPVEDHGYGLVTFFKVPGGFGVQLYQPRYVKNPRPKAASTAVEAPKSKQAAKAPARKPAQPVKAKAKVSNAKKPVKTKGRGR